MHSRLPFCTAARAILAISYVAAVSSPVFAQKIGPEFRVNTTTTGDQQSPAVAINATGRFVVVWTSDGTDGYGLGVYGQRFFPGGNKLGSQFQVNDYTDNDQGRPSVAMRDDGSFVVAWNSREQDGDGNGIFARLFDAAGNKVGTEFQVNTYTFSNESAPHVCVDADNHFVIVWQSTQQDGSSDAVMARRYDPDGLPITDEIMVNRYTYGFQGAPHVGCSDDGNFVVTYCSWEFDGSGYAAVAQRVGRTGGLTGDELLANTFTTSHQDYPDIAVNPDGGFTVVWHSDQQDGSAYGVFGQRYSSSGASEGGEFRVNSETLYSQWWPRVASDDFGSYTVVWQGYSRTGQNDVYARRYRGDGTPHTGEFRVNTTAGGNQERPDIAAGPDGNLVVVWQSQNQDGSGYGIYGQRYTAGTVPVAFSDFRADVEGGNVRLRWAVESESVLDALFLYRTAGQDVNSAVVPVPVTSRHYIDTGVRPGTYRYAIGATMESGAETVSRSVTVTVRPVGSAPLSNHPNPFNPSTAITYVLSQASDVELSIYDANGSLVVVLQDGPAPAGKNTVLWNGRTANGSAAVSGIYFCRMKTAERIFSRRMVLLK